MGRRRQLVRLPDWNSRFIEYIRWVRVQPFQPGILDCGLLLAGAVEALTGVDYASKFRGKYQTLEEGKERLQEVGFNNHFQFAQSILPMAHPSEAMIGDGAIMRTDDDQFGLGVVIGSRVLCLTEHKGAVTFDLMEAKRVLLV